MRDLPYLLSRGIVFLVALFWLGAAVCPAQAASPSVGTVQVYQLQDTSAYVQMSSFTSGSSTASVTMQYGTDTTYGSQKTISGTYGPNATFYAVGGSVTGLSPATTYHCRFKVSDAGGDVFTADQTFTTTAPPVLTTGTVLSVGYVVANVSGSVDPKGHDLLLSYQVNLYSDYRSGGSPGAGSVTPYEVTGIGPVAITSTFNGVPGATYHYRLTGTDTTNSAVYYGADQTITFPSGSTTTLAAGPVADISATVSGSFDPGGQSCLFSFQYGTDTSYGSTQSTVTLKSNPLSPSLLIASAGLTGLQPNTTYHYRVVTYVAIYSATHYGADMSFTTGPPTAPPSFIGLLGGLIDPSPSGATISAYLQSGSSPATVVFDYGRTTSYGTTIAFPGTVPSSTQGSPSVSLTGLTPGTTYHFRARATNTEGSTTSADAVFTTQQAPVVTTNGTLSAGALGAGFTGNYVTQGALYTASFEYGATISYGFTITGTRPAVLQAGPSTVPTDASAGGLLPSTTYHLRLKVLDVNGSAYYGNDVTFTTLSYTGAWRQTYFSNTGNTGSAADLATPAGDGIPNLIKYALGLDPTARSVLPTPTAQSYGGSQRLALAFTRLAFAQDVTLEVQTADSPTGTWTTIAHAINGAPFAAGTGVDPGLVQEPTPPASPPSSGSFSTSTGNVTVYDTVPISQASRRFMRLRVSR